MITKLPTLEQYTWNTIKTKFKKINPEISKIIDKISPDDGHILYLARYPYASMILEKGIFYLPNLENKIVPLMDTSIPSNFRNDLDYNNMPVGVVSENSIESFFTTIHNRAIPSTVFNRGKIIALWRILDEGSSYQDDAIWNVSSGARSICILPKITDKNCYKTLQNKYSMKMSIPVNLHDHWKIFNLLANHEKFPQSWSSEIIYFSKHWFSHKEDEDWNEFYKYLYEMVWNSSAFRRNQFIFDFSFSLVQEKRNLKPNPYLADTARHLFGIASGMMPAFTPLLDNSLAPIDGLQKVFVEDYGLKKYAPIIMGLHHFSFSENRPVYYSFEMPTTMMFSPRSNKASSTMADLRELKHIMDVFIDEIEKSNNGNKKTPLYQLAKSVKYNFYHTEKDKLAEIDQANKIVNLSKAFTATSLDGSEYVFPEFSPFFRGCISISNIE